MVGTYEEIMRQTFLAVITRAMHHYSSNNEHPERALHLSSVLLARIEQIEPLSDGEWHHVMHNLNEYYIFVKLPTNMPKTDLEKASRLTALKEVLGYQKES